MADRLDRTISKVMSGGIALAALLCMTSVTPAAVLFAPDAAMPGQGTIVVATSAGRVEIADAYLSSATSTTRPSDAVTAVVPSYADGSATIRTSTRNDEKPAAEPAVPALMTTPLQAFDCGTMLVETEVKSDTPFVASLGVARADGLAEAMSKAMNPMVAVPLGLMIVMLAAMPVVLHRTHARRGY